MKEFRERREVKLAMQILDYSVRHVELFPEEQEHKSRYVRVDRQVMGAALMWHEIRHRDPYNRIMVAIRDLFDEFFEGLSVFDIMIEAELIEVGDIRPYLSYWLNMMAVGHIREKSGSSRAPEEYDWHRILRVYIAKYNNDRVANLCRRLSCDVAMRETDIEIIQNEVDQGVWRNDPTTKQSP